MCSGNLNLLSRGVNHVPVHSCGEFDLCELVLLLRVGMRTKRKLTSRFHNTASLSIYSNRHRPGSSGGRCLSTSTSRSISACHRPGLVPPEQCLKPSKHCSARAS